MSLAGSLGTKWGMQAWYRGIPVCKRCRRVKLVRRIARVKGLCAACRKLVMEDVK